MLIPDASIFMMKISIIGFTSFGALCNTSNTEQEREELYFNGPLEHIWKRCVFGFCGMDEGQRIMFRIVADSDEVERKQWLEKVEKIVIGEIL